MSSSSELSSVDRILRRLEDSLDKLRGEVRELRTSISTLYASVKDVKEQVVRLHEKINEMHTEFNEKISNLSKRVDEVENRLKEAEENLENHLKKQDYVLEGHSEALMNELALQTLLNIMSKRDEATSFTLLHVGKNPLIAIEDQERITMLIVTEVPSKEVQDTLDELAERLKIFTDKEVNYRVLTIRVPAKEARANIEPIWSSILE